MVFFLPAQQLLPQDPWSSISTVYSPHVQTISVFVSRPFNLSCPSNVLILTPIPLVYSKQNSYHLQLYQHHLLFFLSVPQSPNNHSRSQRPLVNLLFNSSFCRISSLTLMSNYSILPALSSSSILWTVHCFRWFTSGFQTYPMSLPLLLVSVILASLSFCRAYTALNSLSLQCNKTSYSTKDSCLSIFYHHCKQEGTTSMMYSSIHTEPIWHSLVNKTL